MGAPLPDRAFTAAEPRAATLVQPTSLEAAARAFEDAMSADTRDA